MSMTNCARLVAGALALCMFAFAGVGCESDQIEANNKLIQQQQEQLENQQRELEGLKASQNQGYTPGVASAARGGCDKDVEAAATQHGGDKFAAGDFSKALDYYQDALLACPNDARAQVNVARTYEAQGNKVAAIKLYRKAADSKGATVSDAELEAQSALERLQASQLP